MANAKKGDFLRLLSGKGGENSKNDCFLSFRCFWGGKYFGYFDSVGNLSLMMGGSSGIVSKGMS